MNKKTNKSVAKCAAKSNLTEVTVNHTIEQLYKMREKRALETISEATKTLRNKYFPMWKDAALRGCAALVQVLEVNRDEIFGASDNEAENLCRRLTFRWILNDLTLIPEVKNDYNRMTAIDLIGYYIEPVCCRCSYNQARCQASSIYLKLEGAYSKED